METEDQLQDYVVPLGFLAILLIIVGAVVLAEKSSGSWHGIWPLLGGLLLVAFLWYSIYISQPRAERRKFINSAAERDAYWQARIAEKRHAINTAAEHDAFWQAAQAKAEELVAVQVRRRQGTS
jgi:hypothetical protein